MIRLLRKKFGIRWNSDCFKFKGGKISAYECFFGPGINYLNSGK